MSREELSRCLDRMVNRFEHTAIDQPGRATLDAVAEVLRMEARDLRSETNRELDVQERIRSIF